MTTPDSTLHPTRRESRRAQEERWASPWGFEDEYERAPEPSPWPDADESAGSDSTPPPGSESPLDTDLESEAFSSVPEITTRGVTLRFEAPLDTAPDEPAVTLPEKPTQAPQASFKTDSDARFRPPGEFQRPLAEPVMAAPPTPKVEPNVPVAEPKAEIPKAEVKTPSAFPAATPSRLQAAPNPPTTRHAPVPSLKKEIRQQRHSSWGTLISLSLGTLGFTLLAWIYLEEGKRDSDEDLRPSYAIDSTPTTTVPMRLQTFLDSVTRLENVTFMQTPPWTWDTPSLARFVKINSTAVDNLRDLLEDADWHPHHAAWHMKDHGNHLAWGNVRYLLQAQASYLMRRGEEEAAFTAAIDLLELSRRLQELWAWPSYLHRSQDLHTGAVQVLAELLKQTRLSSNGLARFQNEFLHCAPDDALLRQACAAFYLHEKKLLLGAASGEPLDTMPAGVQTQRPSRLFFKTQETLNLFVHAFRDLRDEMARAPYTNLGLNPLRPRLTPSRFYLPNSTGEAYFSRQMEGYLPLPERHALTHAHHSIIQCLFAIRRYLSDHQRLPQKLSDLTPAYLLHLPIDPFSGGALLYSPERGLLHSVGINLLDEAGRITQPPLSDAREPTVELGIAVATPVKK